jgi:hypothetical protein
MSSARGLSSHFQSKCEIERADIELNAFKKKERVRFEHFDQEASLSFGSVECVDACVDLIRAFESYQSDGQLIEKEGLHPESMQTVTPEYNCTTLAAAEKKLTEDAKKLAKGEKHDAAQGRKRAPVNPKSEKPPTRMSTRSNYTVAEENHPGELTATTSNSGLSNQTGVDPLVPDVTATVVQPPEEIVKAPSAASKAKACSSVSNAMKNRRSRLFGGTVSDIQVPAARASYMKHTFSRLIKSTVLNGKEFAGTVTPSTWAMMLATFAHMVVLKLTAVNTLVFVCERGFGLQI